MDITRDVAKGVGPNGVDVRLYNNNGDKLPSVTSVLKTRNQDKSNLYDWQDRNDGENGNANHEHLFWYSRHIGTLGHWYALKELDSSLTWSDDEQQSVDELNQLTADEVENDSPREVLYSILRGDKNKGGGCVSSWGEFYEQYPPYKKGNYYRDELVAQAKRDIEFFKDAQLRLWNKLDITEDNVIAVEQFLFEDEVGYAGQVDLVYDDDGTTVVADLKSSSGCYNKHQLQGAAYAKAIERSDLNVDTVDRLEVHRTHPRSGEMAVHTHKDAPNQSSIHTTKYWNESYDDLWQQFKSLVKNFEYESE